MLKRSFLALLITMCAVFPLFSQSYGRFESGANIFDKDYVFIADENAPDYQLVLRRSSHFEMQTEGLKVVFKTKMAFDKIKPDEWRVRIYYAKQNESDKKWEVFDKEYYDAIFSLPKKSISYKVTGKELPKFQIPNVSQEGWNVFETQDITPQDAVSMATDYFFANYGKVAKGGILYSGVLHRNIFNFQDRTFSYTLEPDQSKSEFLKLSIYRHDGLSDEDVSMKKMVLTTSIEVKDGRRKNKQMTVNIHHIERPNAYSWRTLLSDKIVVMYDFGAGRIKYGSEGEKIKKALEKLSYNKEAVLTSFDTSDFYADDAVNNAIEYFIIRFFDDLTK